jgi:hypothetical protein
MTRLNTGIFILLITGFAPFGVAQSAGTVEELKDCARMADQDARLACYDELGQRVLREEAADRKPTQEKMARQEAETASTVEIQPLPDELGRSKAVNYLGTITSCKKGGSGDWYFFFDNGQVWKQVNRRDLRLKDCKFDATISSDGFGYKMRIDGFERTIRVKRHR